MPDEYFVSFWALKSIDWQILCSSEMSIKGLLGSKIVECPINNRTVKLNRPWAYHPVYRWKKGSSRRSIFQFWNVSQRIICASEKSIQGLRVNKRLVRRELSTIDDFPDSGKAIIKKEGEIEGQVKKVSCFHFYGTLMMASVGPNDTRTRTLTKDSR